MTTNEIEKTNDEISKSPKSTTENHDLEKLDNIARTNCSVCRCGHLKEIHAWRQTMTLREISARLKKDFNLDIAKDSLSRHFLHYAKMIRVRQIDKQLKLFDQTSESVTEHQKKTLFLAKITFDHIIERLEAGTLELGISEFEKLINLYYRVLRDPDRAGDEDLILLFQRASEKMGCNLEQGALVLKKKPQGSTEPAT